MKYVNLPVIFSVILPKKLKNDIMDKSTAIFGGKCFCPHYRMFRQNASYSVFAASADWPVLNISDFPKGADFMENTIFKNRKNVFLLLKERMCRWNFQKTVT